MAVCLVLSRAGRSDEMMRNDGDGRSCFQFSMIFVFPFFPILSYCLARSPISLALVGLLACLFRRVGGGELCGLCGTPLFSVDCSGVIGYIVSRAL